MSLMSFWTLSSVNFLPIRRFTSKTVFSGSMTARFLAESPTSRVTSPPDPEEEEEEDDTTNDTYEGVMRLP